MKTLVFQFLLTALALSTSLSASSQYTAEAGASAQDIIDQIEGSGLTISNFTVTAGGTNQYGTFSYAADGVLGLDSGLVVSTGAIAEVVGPNISEGWSYYNDDYTDVDLASIAPLAVYDACVIEFDVVPKFDTLQIDFVFASEEYNEYVCSDFNDAFAFFVSGPGISGPYTNSAMNFAKLADGTDVSIGTVNSGSVGSWGYLESCGSLDNSDYFVDNVGGSNLEPDGFTVPMQVKDVVVPCETYHVKIVIADAGDSAYDSWVFLESFSCPGQQVAIETPDPAKDHSEEGCLVGEFNLVRSGDLSVMLDVDVTLGGTAIDGTDYSIVDANGDPIASTVTFGVGEDSIPYFVESFFDGATEGTEDITLTLGWNVCAQFFAYDTQFDITDPQVTMDCEADISVSAASASCGAVVTFAEPTADMACAFTVSRTDATGLNSGDTFPIGATTLTWTVNSDNGSVSESCSTVVTVSDINGPTVSCPADLSTTTVTCNADVVLAPASATDACGMATLVNDFNNTGDASGTYPVGSTTVTWTATDLHGNTSTCSHVVAVAETTAPSISCPADVSADAGDACEWSVTIGAPTVSDNCGSATYVNDFNGTTDASGTYPVGTTTVTWTATDDSGNSSTCVMSVSVTGGFEVPTDITTAVDPGECTATVSNPGPSLGGGAPTCTDLLDDDFESGWGNWNDPGSDCSLSNSSTYANGGYYSIRLRDNSSTSETYTDSFDASNMDEITVEFWYRAKSFSSGEDFWLEYSTNGGSSYTFVEDWVNGTDFSNGSHYFVSVTISGPFTSNTRLLFECDASSNGDKVYLDDILVQGCSGSGSACSPVSMVNNFTGTDDASGTYPGGTTEVTWTFTDAENNTYDTVQLVTVGDGDAFALTCANDQSVSTDTGVCTATLDPGSPVLEGGCGSVSLVNDFTNSGSATSTYNTGDTVITWTATDSENTTVTCTQTLTVSDVEAPTAVCQDVTLQLDASGNASLTALQVDGGSSDNCGLQSSVVNPTSFTAASAGQAGLTATLTLSDAAGNTSFCTSNITVVDVTAPTMVCQDIAATLDGTGAVTVLANEVDGGCTDNVGIASLSVSPASFDCTDVGVQTVTLTATDAAGNSATCTAEVTVSDSSAPSLSVMASASGVAAADACTAAISITAASASDNCSGVTVTNDLTGSDDPSGDFAVGTTVITWAATDASGNTQTATTTVVVTDETDPEINCEATVDASMLLSESAATVSITVPTVTDNCTGSTWANDINGLSDASGDFAVGETVVTWTATDASGNTATCTTTVNVTSVGGPAGVNDGLELWFDTDASALDAGGNLASDAEEIASVTDLSGNDFDASQSDIMAQPELYLAEANYRPVMGFDGVDDVLPIAGFAQTTTVDKVQVFVAYKSDFTGASDNGAFLSFDGSEYWSVHLEGDGALGMDFHAGTSKTYETTDIYNDGNVRIASFIFDAGEVDDTRIRMNGVDVLSEDAVGEGTPIGTGSTRYGFIGDGSEASSFNGSTAGDFFHGDIAEVVCYQDGLTVSDVELVESYLAIKYGVTLEHDYKLSDGTVIRAAGDLTYHNNVIGLARDDSGSLDQRQATSSNADGLLRLSTSSLYATNNSNPEFIQNNGSALTMGHDAGEIGYSYGYESDTESNCNRMGRVWRVDAIGSEDPVNVFLPSTSEATHMLVADNADFTENTQVIALDDVGELRSASMPWASGFVSFTCEKTYAWNGSVDTDWDNPDNWDGGVVPFDGANVEMPIGKPTYPALSGDIEVGTFTCEEGSSLDYGGARIHVNCNLNHYETSAQKVGTFIFEGNATQTISGNDPLYLHNVIMDKTGTLALANGAHISGYVLCNDGVLDMTAGDIVLTSDLETTGAIARIGDTAEIIGDSLTLERFFGSGDNTWRMICAPFLDASYEDWNDDIPTTGFAGSDWPNWPSASNPWVNLYHYNETWVNGWAGHKDYGFEPPEDVTDVINHRVGIFAYWDPDNTMLDVTGEFVRGETQFNIDYTQSDYGDLHDGWNLIANPYPATINWDQEEGWEKNNLADAIYLFDPEVGNYFAYVNGIATGDMDGTVGSSQAFWVKAIAEDPSLTINEAAKSTAEGVFMRSQDAEIEALVNIEIHAGVWSDMVVFGYLEGASEGFDPSLDAFKMGAMDANIPEVSFATSEDGFLCINMIDIPEEGSSIPLHVNAKEHENLSLKNTMVDAMDDNICLVLEDTELAISVPFNMGDEYGFTWGNASSNDRFILHLTAPLQAEVMNESCPGESDGMLQVDGYGMAPWNITLIASDEGYTTTYENVTEALIVEDLSPGSYEIHVVGQSELCPVAMEWVYLDEAIPDTFSHVPGPAPCNEGAVGFIEVNIEEEYVWDVKLINDDHQPVYILNGLQHDTVLTGLVAGDYTLESWSSCGNFRSEDVELYDLSDSQVYFEIVDGGEIHLTGATIGMESDVANVASLHWDFGDGTKTHGSAYVEHVYDREANYVVTLTGEGEECLGVYTQDLRIVDELSGEADGGGPGSFALGESSELAEELGLDANTDGSSLFFSAGSGYDGSVTIRLFSLGGKLVYEHTWSELPAGVHQLNPPELTAGLYQMQCFSGEESLFSRKLIFGQ